MKYSIEDIEKLLAKSRYKHDDGWFFPNDLSSFNNKLKYSCKKLYEQGKMERSGDSSDRWGYRYKIKNDSDESV